MYDEILLSLEGFDWLIGDPLRPKWNAARLTTRSTQIVQNGAPEEICRKNSDTQPKNGRGNSSL